ncbi:hypothetical protein CAOG_07722 [Capsaspora owczarzaki ATCC 30864]|uniref:Ribosomal protein/NADH dehydrogenase domain-containing protein n=1 Tax=Capsaspora owczarzaki (strain ATCC 30864) TaxID=595528 RepID=A0A0D2WX32_CAPO3|nr:hypothetical protein CAOG_07722 [Capsaspora owczarzaki ATCC 30864]KJE97288.1 hypothetical protein CAOG_007722 [Capsaspora owczarzaki ATCC 30864]|eukprot:XP_004343596.1 hypothetical protein CAOG_07722 [Capsaspora owczarzaki ATCC 30864]
MSWKASLPRVVRELRIHLCQTSPSSQGARDFVTKQYAELKQAHPTLPILVREAAGIEPRVYARYAFGQEAKADLSNLTSQQVLDSIQGLYQHGEKLATQAKAN